MPQNRIECTTYCIFANRIFLNKKIFLKVFKATIPIITVVSVAEFNPLAERNLKELCLSM